MIAKTVVHTTRYDIEGKRFGRLVAQIRVGRDRWGSFIWLCKCDCGNIEEIIGHYLWTGETQSCGCLHTDVRIEIGKANKTHGMTKTPTYVSWNSMITRCTNINHKFYKHYGGRGITVCVSWLLFENFFADMGERPEGLTLDRRDNDKGYYKENCRWATQSQQVSNRRRATT
jgi:hypothetical protein